MLFYQNGLELVSGLQNGAKIKLEMFFYGYLIKFHFNTAWCSRITSVKTVTSNYSNIDVDVTDFEVCGFTKKRNEYPDKTLFSL